MYIDRMFSYSIYVYKETRLLSSQKQEK